MYEATDTEPLECLDDHGPHSGCSGTVEYRESLTGTGLAIPRCDAHWERRLDREDEIRRRYPQHPPADWSPLDAGEAWDENDY